MTKVATISKRELIQHTSKVLGLLREHDEIVVTNHEEPELSIKKVATNCVHKESVATITTSDPLDNIKPSLLRPAPSLEYACGCKKSDKYLCSKHGRA